MRKSWLVVLALAVLVVGPWVAPTMVAAEEADAQGAGNVSAIFETLTIGGRTLRRVAVSEQTPEMVYLRHDGGLLGVRVAELDRDTRRLLGYEVPAELAAGERGGFRLGRGEMGGQAGEMVAAIGRWPSKGSDFEGGLGAGLGLLVLGITGLVWLLAHLLVSCLLRMICRKADAEPGFMIWLPILQVFPLLKAAGMSRRWPFALVGLSLIGTLMAGFSFELALLISLSSSLLALGLWIAWSIKICLARGKHPIWAVLLLLPGLNFVGLVYLAASE